MDEMKISIPRNSDVFPSFFSVITTAMSSSSPGEGNDENDDGCNLFCNSNL